MLLRYESLLDYCFKCGRLGHILDECTKEVNVRDLSSEDNRRLGAWISVVSPPKRPFIGTGRTNKRIWGKLKGFGGSISKYENHRSLQTNWRERTTTCVANDPGGQSKDAWGLCIFALTTRIISHILGKRKFLTCFYGGQSKEKRSKEETWAKRNIFSVDNDVEILKYPDDSLAVIDDDISKSKAISPMTLVKFEKAVFGGVTIGFEAGKQRDNEKDERRIGNSKKN
ncbi:hypothetical protein Q3G72_019877 [Acer saccharum]|nr:hypothetical protein Q3G72_019877 [Acer saccharum]